MTRADLIQAVTTLATLRTTAEADRAAAHAAALAAAGGAGSHELEEAAVDADTVAANLNRAWELLRATVQQLDLAARRTAGVQNVVAGAMAARDAALAAQAAAETVAATRQAQIDRLQAENDDLKRGRVP